MAFLPENHGSLVQWGYIQQRVNPLQQQNNRMDKESNETEILTT